MSYVLLTTALGALWCAVWIVMGIWRGRVLNNMARMIGRDDGAFEVMLVVYGVGFGACAVLAALALTGTI